MMSSLSRLIFNKANDFSFMEAIRIRGRSISYQELNERALQIAAALIECGAEREAIGIVGQRKASSYFGLVGILFAGCYYTPINTKYSEARLLSILRDAKIRFLVGDRADLEMLEPVLNNKDAPRIEAIILPEGQSPVGKNWRDELSLPKLHHLKKPVDIKKKDLAYLLYTSGSTGTPKGVQVTHANVLAFLQNMSKLYALDKGFRASQTFDFSFDPSVSDMFFTWSMGGVLCVLPEEEILLPHEYIQREGITFWNSVPSIAGFMKKMGHLTPGCFPEVRNSMFCGEQFPIHLAAAWQIAAPNSTIENLYGPTEATIYISRHVYTAEEKNKTFKNSIVPIGRPFPEHEFFLIDEFGKKIPDGEIGEIVFKGPQITKGYLHDQEKTDSVFVTFDWDSSGDKWYKSGDIGFYNADKNLECIGRRDSQIKLGGRRIELGEIEAVLARHPATQDVVVVPLRDENNTAIGCVAFTLNEVSKQERDIVRQESMKLIERIFFPKQIITIKSFPLSPSGKVDRKALADLAHELMAMHGKTSP
jgi:amino acid adenylation domain-containing protein